MQADISRYRDRYRSCMLSAEEKMETPVKLKKSRYTLEQLQCMCDFVRINHTRLFGQPLSPCERVAETRRKAWEELSEQLAALGCPGRTASNLRQSWSDLKKKANEYARQRNKTGGGTCKIKPKMEMILAAMRDKAVYGIRGMETETGASEKPLSQNTAACAMLAEMGNPEEEEEVEEVVEETVVKEASKEEGGQGGHAGRQDVQHKRRCSVRYDQHTEYQERLLQVQQETLRTKQAMLQTFNNIHDVFKEIRNSLQQFVNGHQ
ncbi:uncharacterized protein LOC121424119 [Lytechinus variegatus]|uniref:uncharacterized protein LOC121424119 n=1 Tax=Lytechinus variegatus TaxID=7654 RepID=UPI001BB10A3F|nr:uncharacterized protein LOC121424119 [Lytechinus variegatus]